MTSRDPNPSLSFSDWQIPELLASYERFGGFNEHSSNNMPSKGAVSQICHDLLQIRFPGFHDDDAILAGTLAQLTAERMLSVIRRLQEQVRKNVRIGHPQTPTGKTVPSMKRFVKVIPAPLSMAIRRCAFRKRSFFLFPPSKPSPSYASPIVATRKAHPSFRA